MFDDDNITDEELDEAWNGALAHWDCFRGAKERTSACRFGSPSGGGRSALPFSSRA
jgi:hypothetical protein